MAALSPLRAEIGDWSEGTLNPAAALNRSGVTQLRLSFALDDDDKTADSLGYRQSRPIQPPRGYRHVFGRGDQHRSGDCYLSPANGSTFPQGITIAFSGTANDIEDRNLTAGLRWMSSLDASIGGGGSSHAILTPGTHTVTAR